MYLPWHYTNIWLAGLKKIKKNFSKVNSLSRTIFEQDTSEIKGRNITDWAKFLSEVGT